jgi:hypothetical protein
LHFELQTWHADQHHTNAAAVKDGAELLQTRHLEPVHFVDEQQLGRVAGCSALPGPVEDGLGNRGFGSFKTLRFTREPIVMEEEVVTSLVELPLRLGNHRLRLAADGLED